MMSEPNVSAVIEAMAAAFRNEMNRLDGEGRHQSHDLQSLRGVPAAFRGLVDYLAEHELVLNGDGMLVTRADGD